MEEKTPEYIKARDRAIKYILFKLRTSFEVYNKLISLDFSEKIASKVVADLSQLEYINDDEYIKKFIESNKKTKKLSKSMIKLKLKNKGLDKELVEKYLESSDFSDVDVILKFLEKKHFSFELDIDEQMKIKNYCLRKGFSISDITKAIRMLKED